MCSVSSAGYLNSLMNPIIYAKFNKDFRRPIQLFLRCHCLDVNERLRAEQFAEQFGTAGGNSSVNGANDLSASRLKVSRRTGDIFPVY